MKKLLIGLLALSAVTVFANDCDLIYKKDINIQDKALSSERIESLSRLGFNLIEVNELNSSHDGKLAILATKVTNGADVLWYDGNEDFKYHIVKFYNVNEVEHENKTVKMINYVGLSKKLKRLDSCDGVVEDLNRKVSRLLRSNTASQIPQNQINLGFKIINH